MALEAQDNPFPYVTLTETADPSTPAAGTKRLWVDTDDTLKIIDEADVVTSLVGSWANYTPTLTATTTNPTLGSSVVAGRWVQNGKVVSAIMTLDVTTGGAWNAGSGIYEFSLPVAVGGSALTTIGQAHVLDAGTARYAGICMVSPSGTKTAIIVIADATGDRVLKHNVPVTWATGDAVHLFVTYEAA